MKIKLKYIVYEFFTATVGNMLLFFLPKKASQLSQNGMTIVNNEGMSVFERLMRRAILSKYEKKQDFNRLEELHKNYWTNKGSDFFLETEHSFEKEFLPNCAFIFDELQNRLSQSSGPFNTLVEIGTGNGRVLEYLSSKFPTIDQFIGIDLSTAQIKINNEKFNGHPRLEFVAADGFDWVKKHGTGNTIFLTSRGVLEYFTEERLQAFFRLINNLGKVIFIAIEPKGTDHDFAKNPNSQPYGYERSFSHNYPRLFENSGFDIWHLSYKPLYESAVLGFVGAEN
ncbi:MAG TPA: class I SAM-dependent methyltransferase [Aquaticitalea sp.]|nr:class I SAM-dependent methyltransferase [Aquaticitalea sp.]